MKRYLSISDVAQLLGVNANWVYKKSKELEPAKVKLNGKAIQPTRFDSERLALLLGGSVTTEQNQKISQSKSPKKKGDSRLWG